MNNSQRRALEMKLIYEREMGGEGSETTLTGLLEIMPGESGVSRAHQTVEEVFERLSQIDAMIQSHARDWALERMARIDLAILRLAAYELMYRADIPTGATINEAVELSRAYSSEESGAFINGVLGNMGRQLEEPRL